MEHKEFYAACIVVAEAMNANHIVLKNGENYLGGFCTVLFSASVHEQNCWEVASEKAEFPHEILHKGRDGKWAEYGMRYVGDPRGYLYIRQI